MNFTGTNLGLGGTNNSQIILTQHQRRRPTIALDDGIIGGWATVNGTDFAGYIAPSGTAGGVGALGTTGYPAYTAADALTAGTRRTTSRWPPACRRVSRPAPSTP